MKLEPIETRLIKFRLWNGKKMIIPSKIHNNTFNNEEKLMQFTGIIDSTGKEIYEGDIVVPKNYKDIPNTIIFTGHGFYRCKEISGKLYLNILGTCDLKVIGNIFENKITAEEIKKPEGKIAFVKKPTIIKKPLKQ